MKKNKYGLRVSSSFSWTSLDGNITLDIEVVPNKDFVDFLNSLPGPSVPMDDKANAAVNLNTHEVLVNQATMDLSEDTRNVILSHEVGHLLAQQDDRHCTKLCNLHRMAGIPLSASHKIAIGAELEADGYGARMVGIESFACGMACLFQDAPFNSNLRSRLPIVLASLIKHHNLQDFHL